MNITGIICEYNPFHNGHKYHIEQTRKICGSSYIIGIMSGCYTQRGTPAITDKYTRTLMALKSGCDMIIELPVRYCVSSAEGFAAAGINLLNHTRVTNSICFGTESGNLDNIYEIARILRNEPDEFKLLLKDSLKTGLPYPAARETALKQYLSHINKSDLALTFAPNNILALEYIKACLDTDLKAYTVKRSDKGYHNIDLPDSIDLTDSFDNTTAKPEITPNVCSAEAIRHIISNSQNTDNIKQFVPEDTLTLLDKPVNNDDFSLLLYASIASELTHLEDYDDMSSQLADRIRNNINEYSSWDSFIQLIKTKQYTYTRIQRALLHCMLGLKKIPVTTPKYQVPYIRVLGFKKESSELMKLLTDNADIPVITRPARAADALDDFGKQLFDEDIFASHLYKQVVRHKYHLPSIKNEYTKGLIIV